MRERTQASPKVREMERQTESIGGNNQKSGGDEQCDRENARKCESPKVREMKRGRQTARQTESNKERAKNGAIPTEMKSERDRDGNKHVTGTTEGREEV